MLFSISSETLKDVLASLSFYSYSELFITAFDDLGYFLALVSYHVLTKGIALCCRNDISLHGHIS